MRYSPVRTSVRERARTAISLQAFDERDAARALRCDRWTRAVAVRDPLDRLLSAFLDKCVNGVQVAPASYCHLLFAPCSHAAVGLQRRRHCPHWRESRRAPPSFRAFVQRLTPHDVEAGDLHIRRPRR